MDYCLGFFFLIIELHQAWIFMDQSFFIYLFTSLSARNCSLRIKKSGLCLFSPNLLLVVEFACFLLYVKSNKGKRTKNLDLDFFSVFVVKVS
jgi:hypothetical protein